MKLYSKHIYTGIIELLTGLHIGDSKESTDIGGVDSPIVRRKDNNQPYIPGSSIKGKMRSLLEIANGQKDTFRNGSHIIGKLFGSINNDNANPSRLIVRDASLNKESAQLMSESEFFDIPFSEIKIENVINRLKGTAEHPRQIERVPAGSKFDFEFIINIIANDHNEAESLEVEFDNLLNTGIKLLQDDYLGGNGSRGYGHVRFEMKPKQIKTIKDYYESK